MVIEDVIAHDVQTDHRAGNMLAALIETDEKRAKLTLTTEIVNEAGRKLHQTFDVKGWTGRDGGKMLTIEVAGSGDYHEGVRPIKVFHVDLGALRLRDARDERNADPLLRYAAKAAIGYAWLGEAGLPAPKNGSIAVTEASNCVYCSRKLTDPESQRRGSGGDCYGKATGTKTIRSRTRAA